MIKKWSVRMTNKTINYLVDIISMIFFTAINVNGMLLLIIYHVKRNLPDYIFWGFNKPEWILIHKILSVAVTVSIIWHILLHFKWIKDVTVNMRFLKSDFNNKSTFYLFAVFCFSAITGIVSWCFNNRLIGYNYELRHSLMEFHDKISIILVILFCIHFIKKIKWLFNATKDFISLKN